MKTYLLIILLLPSISLADIPNLKVEHLYLEAEKERGTNRSYNLPEGHSPSDYANLGFDLTFTKYVYSNSRVKSIVDQSQFRNVSLDSELGVRYSGVDLYIRHFSGHALDSTYDKRFPQENSIGIRFNIIGNK